MTTKPKSIGLLAVLVIAALAVVACSPDGAPGGGEQPLAGAAGASQVFTARNASQAFNGAAFSLNGSRTVTTQEIDIRGGEALTAYYTCNANASLSSFVFQTSPDRSTWYTHTSLSTCASNSTKIEITSSPTAAPWGRFTGTLNNGTGNTATVDIKLAIK